MANIKKFQENLVKHGFATSFFENESDACDYLKQKINGKSVGFGASKTVVDSGIYDALKGANTCYFHWVDKGDDVLDKASKTEVYVCSLNAVSENGELVNIDGTCNRIASCVYGHKQVYFIIGVNKICDDYEKAVWRARNIASPKNAVRLKKNTPCAIKGDRCYDCNSPERICGALMTIWLKPKGIDYCEVVIINRDLGF